MRHMMFDLESFSLSNTPVLASIGAVFFDPVDGVESADGFYDVLDMQSQLNAGSSVDMDTILWWLEQEKSAQKALLTPQTPIHSFDKQFRAWIDGQLRKTGHTHRDLRVWGYPATSDNVWIKSMYDTMGLNLPWEYWQNRCMSTVKSLYLNLEVPWTGTAHNALDDALWQAEYMVQLCRRHKIKLD